MTEPPPTGLDVAVLAGGLGTRSDGSVTTGDDGMVTSPKLSVLSTNRNMAHWLAETLDSIFRQSFTDFEAIMVDGASTDGSTAVLAAYPHLRWISEPDANANEGFDKAITMARGEYVTFCPVSDGYLSRNWFARAVAELDADPTLSLVWGADALMNQDGDLYGLVFPQFHRKPAPCGRDFLAYWLGTHLWFPEQNYVIRRSVLSRLWPSRDAPSYFDHWNPFLRVILGFHTGGYLSKFLPIIPNWRRLHGDSVTEATKEHGLRTLSQYVDEIDAYGQALLAGRARHQFRAGDGSVIGDLGDQDLAALAERIEHWRSTHPVHGPRNLG
ncbi:MAG: glycosyltransferase [Magnetospirillum sp.]